MMMVWAFEIVCECFERFKRILQDFKDFLNEMHMQVVFFDSIVYKLHYCTKSLYFCFNTFIYCLSIGYYWQKITFVLLTHGVW